MPVLHIISSNTAPDSIQCCLSLAAKCDGILFTDTAPAANLVRQTLASEQLYYLSTANEGGAAESLEGVSTVDYTGWVQLCCDFDKVISW